MKGIKKAVSPNFSKNISISLINFAFSIFMTLWFTPFIIHQLGVEAYGYTNLILNLINIATVITLAITSMSSRYLTIELQRQRTNEANKYFNSILFSLVVLSFFLLFIFTIVLFNLEKVINISDNFVGDVKILFFLACISFLVTLISTPFLGGVYFQNKLSITYLFNILNYGFRYVLCIVVFYCFKPILWIPNLAILIVTIMATIYYLMTYKKMMPGISISISKFNLSYALTVIQSGIWISISKAGSVLLGTLNTYFANIFIGPGISGVYAAVLQLQTLIIVLVNAIVPSFIPEMYKKFAENKMDSLISYVKKAILFLSIPLGVVVGGVLAYGKVFMVLWLGKGFGQYEFMLVLVIIYLPLILSAEVLNQFNITINRIKVPALVTLLFGGINVLLIFMLFYLTDWGIYSIIIGQLITSTIRGILFYPIYSAKEVGVKISTFYPEIAIGVGVSILTTIIGLCLRFLINPSSWMQLIFSSLLTLVLVTLIIFTFFINKDIKKTIKNKVFKLHT
ncbi:oligosaccharide flippase family protein [Ectobacillus sp. sgz5001026]|uniref:oligosaccharide flippase family protein n=1 Tax=Ectobacillus sp. sgz5001026 TaxID=3242473 RepID=UPI0036D2472F